jgi:uncharacterized BrkB/YihY/UPF0761 family membrane protein
MVMKKQKSLPIGLIISIVSSFVGSFIKDLLSRNQIITFFDRQGFNNIVIVIISMSISIGFALIWIYIILKCRKKSNK